jgi:IS5 family transposase
VQPKNITFPTDAKLLHAAVKGLVRLAQKHGVQLRQSYRRVAKHAAMMAGRYAHAKQFTRLHRQLRLMRTRLGPAHPRYRAQDRRPAWAIAGFIHWRMGQAADKAVCVE